MHDVCGSSRRGEQNKCHGWVTLKPLIQNYTNWWMTGSILELPKQASNHKNDENYLSIVKLAEHVEEQFSFPSHMCWLRPAARC